MAVMSSDVNGARTFTCDNCGKTFDSDWSDEEAAAEAQENFPGLDITDPDESGVVCDDCYQRIMSRARAEAPEAIGWRWRDYEPDACYRTPGGSTVHVKPGCRC